ncbi:MAG: hypothetical protein U0175_06195 [Caldilineaceae bacterium]
MLVFTQSANDPAGPAYVGGLGQNSAEEWQGQHGGQNKGGYDFVERFHG